MTRITEIYAVHKIRTAVVICQIGATPPSDLLRIVSLLIMSIQQNWRNFYWYFRRNRTFYYCTSADLRNRCIFSCLKLDLHDISAEFVFLTSNSAEFRNRYIFSCLRESIQLFIQNNIFFSCSAMGQLNSYWIPLLKILPISLLNSAEFGFCWIATTYTPNIFPDGSPADGPQ